MSQSTDVPLIAPPSLHTLAELVEPIRVAIELGAIVPVIEGSLAYLVYITKVPMTRSQDYDVEVLGVYPSRERALSATRTWIVRFWDDVDDHQMQPWYDDETLLEMSGNEPEYPALYAEARVRFLETATDEGMIERLFGAKYNGRGDECRIEATRVQR